MARPVSSVPACALFAVVLIAAVAPAAAQTRQDRGYAHQGVYVGLAPQINATLDGVTKFRESSAHPTAMAFFTF